MIKVFEQSDEHDVAWDKFVEFSQDSTIAHRIGWKRIMVEGLGHRPKYLIAMDDSRVTGILPMIILRAWWKTKYLISLPWIDYGGILAENSETEKLLFEEAVQIAGNEKAEFIEFRTTAAGSMNLELRKDKVTFLLKLEKDFDKIWTGFGPKLRNQIRKAEKSGLTTEFGGGEFLDDFYRVISYNMRDLGTPVWGRKFFETILTAFPNSAQIILVKKDYKVIAAGLLLYFKDRLYIPTASSYRSMLKNCPNHALYWAAIKKGCEEGYRYFDFGRSSWDSNTFNFKKQWVPEPIQLHWQYYLGKSKVIPALNPSNPKYKILIKLWKKMPLSLANYLGPKIIRNFP